MHCIAALSPVPAPDIKLKMRISFPLSVSNRSPWVVECNSHTARSNQNVIWKFGFALPLASWRSQAAASCRLAATCNLDDFRCAPRPHLRFTFPPPHLNRLSLRLSRFPLALSYSAYDHRSPLGNLVLGCSKPADCSTAVPQSSLHWVQALATSHPRGFSGRNVSSRRASSYEPAWRDCIGVACSNHIG